ncbi:MAG: ATP-binding protein [Gemmatimonadaceae bacterium]
MRTDPSRPSVPSPTPIQESAEVLLQRLETAEGELSALREELAETNLGVVALYAELEDKAAQLRDASELKSRFLSYMSHEFRTPLGAIRSVTRLLLDRLDGPLSVEQERQIGFVQSSAVELTEMVNDLLDLAKIEAGRITISPEWFEMVHLFATLRGMFKPIVNNDRVSLIFEEPVDVPRLYTDDTKLAQILRNFVSNALKFTMQGEVRVRAERHHEDSVVFSVSDTGIGIPEEHLAHLFNDFVQLNSPIQKRLRGTGLGLSVSKKFAELLGGRVHVESTFGQGSNFFLTIPIRLQPTGQDPQLGADAPALEVPFHGR